jgi:spore coat protein H
MLGVVLVAVAVVACGQRKDPAAPTADSPLPERAAVSALPVYELKIDPKDLKALERDPSSNERRPATFIANGETYAGVKLRYRGQWARSWPKKPLKIFFNHGKLFEGRRCLNLNSGWRDPAFVREPLAYHVYAACGVPAPTARMVRLQVNGEFMGLYIEVEQPDKAFLSRIDLKGAALFKATSDSNEADERDLGSEKAFSAHYEKETQKDEGFRDLQLFCHELARTTNAVEFFTRRVDMEKYVNYLAATALIQNWDCFNRNHFLLFDGRGSQKWFVVPWDLDRTLGDHWGGGFGYTQLPALLGTRRLPGTTGWNRLEDRFLSETPLRRRFLDRLSELLEKEFKAEKLFPILDRFESEIAADAKQDRRRWPGSAPDLHSGIAQVKSYIERRRSFLLGEVRKLRENEPPTR